MGKAPKDILLIVFFIISIIFASTMIGILIYSKTANKLEYKETPIMSIYTNYAHEPKESKQYYKEQIDELFNNPLYIYTEKSVQSKGYYGKAYIIPRIVILDKSIDIKNYIFTLAHELVHIKYITECERFTNFQTFKVLYESNIPDLQYVALWYAKKDMAGKIHYEYSCWAYIYEYLKGEYYGKSI